MKIQFTSFTDDVVPRRIVDTTLCQPKPLRKLFREVNWLVSIVREVQTSCFLVGGGKSDYDNGPIWFPSSRILLGENLVCMEY